MADMTSPQDLDLRTCDVEPIHVPGAIQGHGMLLALDGQRRVVMTAGDVSPLAGAGASLLGSSIADYVDLERLDLDAPSDLARYAGRIDAGGSTFDVLAHRSAEFLLLELEPIDEIDAAGAALQDQLARSGRIAQAADLETACTAAAEAIRHVTGYDRVMIYRFLEDDTGQVIAEARASSVESFLNHRYPASDIPRQARALYVKNPIRVIPDVAYRPAPIQNELTPLDLGGAMLRSVSPVHIQYLKNMGVGASASVSIIRNGELWGLIACHHLSARYIGHERRLMCRQLALVLELAVTQLEEESSHREALRLTRRREELLPTIAAAENLREGLCQTVDELFRAIPAHGLALAVDSQVLVRGVTPPAEAVRELARKVSRASAPDVFATDQLGQFHPGASEWSASASGLLSIVVSRAPGIVILWFRAEQEETVNWAGNPHKPLDGDAAAAGTLSPRKSFEIWAELVRGRSRPWRANEQEAAQQLAVRLDDISRHMSTGQLNRFLSDAVVARDEALAEKDLLVREVHHRVQNNLQLVTSMLKLQEREVEDEAARRQLDLARDRIQSIATLHRRLWRSDDLQVVNLESFFAELTDELVKTWGEEWRDRVKVDVAPLRLPGNSALTLGLVVTELLTNAFKHAYSGEPGPVTLSVRERGGSLIAVMVSDNGVGGGGQAKAGSFGSRLIQRLVQQIGGELQIGSNDPGTCVTLTVPRTA